MKCIHSFFLLIIFLCILTGCVRKSPETVNPGFPLNEKELMDSINNLDSLVNVMRADNPVLSLHYAKNALLLGFRSRSVNALAKAYIAMGNVYINVESDSSYFYFSEALKIVEKYKIDHLRPYLLFNLANFYLATFDYKTSVILLDSVIKLASKLNDNALVSNAFNNLGNIKFDLHDFPDAKQYFDTAYKIAIRYSLNKQAGVSLGNLARFEKDTLKSIQLHKDAIRILERSPGTEVARALIFINIGFLWTNQDSAVKYYLQALNLADSGGSNEVRMSANNNLAYAYIIKNEFSKARECLLKRAIPLAEKDKNYDWLSTLYDTYTDLNIAVGNNKAAAISERMALQNKEIGRAHV